MTTEYRVYFPLKTVSELNVKEHWGTSALRHKKQKELTRFLVQPLSENLPLPAIVELKRYASKKLDSDNLLASFKWIRDTIADILIPGLPAGIADDDPRIQWEYEQELCSRKFAGVQVNIKPLS